MCCLGPNPRFYACWLSLLPTDQLAGCYKRQGRRELEKQSQLVCIGKAFISASPEPLLSVIHPIGRKLGHWYLFQLKLHLFYSSIVAAKGVLPTLRLVYVPFYLSPESSKTPTQHRTMSVFFFLIFYLMYANMASSSSEMFVSFLHRNHTDPLQSLSPCLPEA